MNRSEKEFKEFPGKINFSCKMPIPPRAALLPLCDIEAERTWKDRSK